MARRVNTRFLVIFSVIVVGGVLAAFVVAGPGKYWFRANPSKRLTAEADALVKQADAAPTAAERKEKLDGAVRLYQQALASDAKNPDLFVRIGDLMSKMAPYDVYTYVGQSRQAWEKALELNPGYVPALHRLQDSYYQETQIGNQSAVFFTRLRERATQLSQVDPKDVRAQALKNIAVLNQYVANIETPADDVNAAVEALGALIKQHPDAPELADMVFYVAGAKAKQGFDKRRGGQTEEGEKLVAQATQAFDDALKAPGQDKNANLHYRYYELLRFVRGERLRLVGSRKEAEAILEQYAESLRREAEAARQFADPDKDPSLFVKAHLAAYDAAYDPKTKKRDEAAAKAVMDALYQAKPDDQRVRLAVAKMWRYARDEKTHEPKLNDAIELLEKPIADAGWVGVEAWYKPDLEIKTLSELANMYVDRFSTLKEAERPDALKQLEGTYARLLDKARERSEVLKVRGKIELLRGGQDAAIRAIQTFEKAQAQAVVQTGNEDVELTFLLARAYFASRQTGNAKAQLEKFLARLPGHTQATLMMAQLLVAEGDMKGAEKYVKTLEEQIPKDPDYIRLKLAMLKPGDAVEAKALFDRLPEGKDEGLSPAARRAQRLAKAAIAPLAPISSPDEALRLYKLVLAENPGDLEALQGARNVLIGQHKEAEAIALLEAGQKADPKNAERIGLVLKQLRGASEEELKAAAEAVLQKETDPLTRELKLYELYKVSAGASERSAATREGRGDRMAADAERKKADAAWRDAFAHLREAERIKFDEPRVLDQMFQYHVHHKDWDKANWYADRLAEKNADQAGGLIYRFKLAMARGQVAEATDFARDMTTRLKEFAPSWVFLGQAQAAAKKYDEAVTSFAAALEKQSENPDALDGIIDAYYKMHKPAEALRYIERGLKGNPNSPRLNAQWRAYQLNHGDPALVIKPALAERDANPQDPARWQNLGQAQLAAAQKRDKDSARYAADARATFAEAVKKWPAEKAFWAFLAEVAAFTNDKAGGEQLLKDMVARPEFKDDPEPSLMLADHYLRNDNAAAAEATIKGAIDRFPDKVDLRRRLAAYYTQTGRAAEALKLLDPASPDKLVRQQVVEIYMLQKKFDQAERLLTQLVESQPGDAQVRALMGVVQLNLGRPEEAIKSLDAALALDPTNAAALFARGSIRLGAREPQLDAAIKDLSTLRDAAPQHVEARVKLAEAYRQKQQYDAAARELEEVLRLAPARGDARVSLVSLYVNSFRPPAWDKAERLVNQAKQSDPRNILWPRALANLYVQRGAFDRAVKEIDSAMKLDAQNASEIKGYAQSPDLVRDYLDVLEKAGMYPQLATLADRLLQNKDVAATEWWVYVKRAVARANTGKKDEALADFEKALTIAFAVKAAGADAQTAVVDKLGETLDPAKAIARFAEQAKQPGAAGGRWQVVLAALYQKTGDRARALQAIDDVRAKLADLDDASDVRAKLADLDDASRVTALTIGGNIYMTAAVAGGDAPQLQKARAVYEELLAKRPDDLGALNNLSLILAEYTTPPDLPKALEYSQRAYELVTRQNADPAVVANMLDSIGWVNVLAGGANLDRGIDHLNNSLRAAEIPDAHYHLGVALLRKNNPVAAKRSLMRASEILQARSDAGQEVDKTLKGKVDEALAKAEKAQFAPTAGTP